MSKLQLNQSLKDVLPTFSGSYPPALVSYTDSIYQLSLQKLPTLPHRADVARYHLCAFLAVEKYQDRFSLPAPVSQRIPVQPKFLDKLLDDIQDKVVSSMGSPVSTPKKLFTAEMSPTKRPHTPSIGSPLKKLRKLSDASDDINSFTAKSPFNPDGKVSHELRNEASPFNIPSKPSSPGSPRNLFKSPRSSPLKNAAASSAYSPRYLRHLTMPEFISFANNFYIPASVTPSILETFMIEKYKFVKKNEWLLACGLIHAAYVRINDKLLKNTIGKKSEFQDQLFQYQKGGLMKGNMIEWINRIEESIKGQPWALDLELKYVHNDWTVEDTTREKEIQAKLGRGWDIVQGFGSMITPPVMFDKPSQLEYYSVWTKRVREKVKSTEPVKPTDVLKSTETPKEPVTTS
ncbi:hypothetical protein JCM33374_g3043 [Metschnikowia sp. JCM 33374]|nr:hypothetical protein JCM33374_g3043 [Metschnikowia sp. JCM 33374]